MSAGFDTCVLFKKTLKLLVLMGVLFLMTCSVNASMAQSFTYSGSVSYANGKYYLSKTSESLYVNNGLSMSYSKFNIYFDVSYIFQNSPWISYTTKGGIATGGPHHRALSQQTGNGKRKQKEKIVLQDTISYSQSGFGDPFASIRYDLYSSYSGATQITIISTFKAPLTDPVSGFGTGEWDFSFGSSLLRKGENCYWNASVAYWYFGDMPELELKNALSYSLGLGYQFNRRPIMLLYSVQGMSKIVSGTEAPVSTGVGFSYRVRERITLSSTLGVGLTESLPDFSLGVGWMIGLD